MNDRVPLSDEAEDLDGDMDFDPYADDVEEELDFDYAADREYQQETWGDDDPETEENEGDEPWELDDGT